jgi:cell division protein FtsQ
MIVAKGRVRRRVKLIAAGLAALLLIGGGWVWLRDSSLVAVRRVTVTGVSGPDAGQIRSVLVLAARSMTTLDVRLGPLHTAVAPYPVVKDLQVSAQFPHGMRIHVVEQLPVAALVAGGQTVAASPDGTLIHDAPTASLPEVSVRAFPGGSRVTDPTALNALALLAATPEPLLAKISQVTTSAPHGLVAQLRNGPTIYFGTPTLLHAKWVAATEVLAAPTSAGATYIDVADPARPAAGVGTQALSAAGLATTGSQTGADGSGGETASSSQASASTGGA